MRPLQYLIAIFFGASAVQTVNILAIFPLPSKSHFVMFERLMKKVAEIGHDVDIATHFPSEEVPPRYNQLNLLGSIPIFQNNLSMSIFEDMSHYDIVHFMTVSCGVDVCEATLKSPVLKNLKKTKKKYDLVVTEIFGADCMLGFGHYFKAPTISMISSVNLPWSGDRFGIPDNPSYIPTYYSGTPPPMSLYERLENTVILIVSKFYYVYFTAKDSNRIAKDFFGPDLPSLEHLAKKTSLLLVNSHFSIDTARPIVPNVIEVGGLHINEPKPLPEYYEKLVTTDIKKGIIFLTMGSMVLTETFEHSKLQGMFDAFGELPYKVLWKANRNNIPKNLKIPSNIHFETWMPQMDILCHPNTKLFVSHGGLMGSQEAVYCGVPRIGIPLFADQDSNIMVAQKKGLLAKVSYKEISKTTILNAAKKVLEDPSYKLNCQQLAKQFKDRPLSALDTGVYWIEYVIRHNGAPHLRTVGADLPWYQYYLIDVGVIFLAGFIAVLYLMVAFTKLVLKITVWSICKEKVE